jgi:hypothetical protein
MKNGNKSYERLYLGVMGITAGLLAIASAAIISIKMSKKRNK